MKREAWFREFAAAMAEHDKPDLDAGRIDLLRELATDPASGLVELAPGVWHVAREVGDDSAR